MIKKIMVVDDEISFLSGFSKALSKICHFDGEIKTVSNGNDAIKEFDNCSYDICFLDINLPDINGLDIMKMIKEKFPQTKIVVMTASYLDDSMKSVIENNASLFIPKPVEIDTVKSFIDIAMQGHNQSGSYNEYDDTGASNSDDLKREKRQYARMSCSRITRYSVHIFYNWELKSGLVADIINMSEGGVAIKTNYPLAVGNMIKFEEGFQNRKGIVKWWNKYEEKYKAGIKLV